MKNGDQPAAPTLLYNESTGERNGHRRGLTKREMIAAMAMQGMLANPEITNHTSGFPSTREVIRYADELLKQLETK